MSLLNKKCTINFGIDQNGCIYHQINALCVYEPVAEGDSWKFVLANGAECRVQKFMSITEEFPQPPTTEKEGKKYGND